MEYMGNKEFWSNKFENRGEIVLGPEESLVENLGYLKRDTVIDIACGDGRNALFLIQNGFEVTGIDFSEKALKRLCFFADQRELPVNTVQIDLTKLDFTKEIGIFDNIIINHYRLDKAQYSELTKHITYGGILFVSGFGEEHKVDDRIRQEDLIRSTDFDDLYHSFDLIKKTTKQDERGYFVTYIFKRK